MTRLAPSVFAILAGLVLLSVAPSAEAGADREPRDGDAFQYFERSLTRGGFLKQAKAGDASAIAKVQEAILWWTLEDALDSYGIFHGAPPEDPAEVLALTMLWPLDTKTRPWPVVTSASNQTYPRVVVDENGLPFANWKVQGSQTHKGNDAKFGSWHTELQKSTTPAGRRYWQERYWEQLDAPSSIPFAEPMLLPLIAYKLVHGTLPADPAKAFQAFRIGMGQAQIDRLVAQYPDARYWRDPANTGVALELRRTGDRWLIVWEDRPVRGSDEEIYWSHDAAEINRILREMKPWTVISQLNVPTINIPGSAPVTLPTPIEDNVDYTPDLTASDIRSIESKAQRTLNALAEAQEDFRSEDPAESYGSFRDMEAYEYIDEGYRRGNLIPYYSLAVFHAGSRSHIVNRRRVSEPYYVIVAAPDDAYSGLRTLAICDDTTIKVAPPRLRLIPNVDNDEPVMADPCEWEPLH